MVDAPENLPQLLSGFFSERPLTLPKNSIYYSVDTGTRDRYLGNGVWKFLDTLQGSTNE